MNPIQTTDNILERKEACDITFTTSERKLIFEALLYFIDSGNTLDDNDARTLLGKHLDMRSKPMNSYTGQPPITTWVHSSILQSTSIQFDIGTPTIAAELYCPNYEGEYYFTPKPKHERQCVKTRTMYFLLSLATSTHHIKDAIVKRKQCLNQTTEISNSNLILHAEELLTLCQKIKLTTYSESLKNALKSYVNKSNLQPITPALTTAQAYDHILRIEKNPNAKAQALLLLCETTQKTNILTHELMAVLLDMYYHIYSNFKLLNKVESNYPAIMFEFFVNLKLLLLCENPPLEHYECCIYLLSCTYHSMACLK